VSIGGSAGDPQQVRKTRRPR